MTGAITRPHFPSEDKGKQVSIPASLFPGFTMSTWLILGQSCLVCLLNFQTYWADEVSKGPEAGKEMSTKAKSAGPRVLQYAPKTGDTVSRCEVSGLGLDLCSHGAHAPVWELYKH